MTIDYTPAPILRYFEYAHLQDTRLQKVSSKFWDLASWVDHSLPAGAEKSTALRKLLEAKDAAVRAALPDDGSEARVQGGNFDPPVAHGQHQVS